MGESTRSQDRKNVFASLVLALIIGCLASGSAWSAQESQGSIYGYTQPAPNQTVVIVNTGTGLTRSANVGSTGQFNFTAVPAGTYNVTLQQSGQTVATQKGVHVQIGIGTSVDFTAQQAQSLGAIVVTGNTINPIDVTTSSASLNVNAQQIETLPVARNALSIAMLAPTVVENNIFTTPSGISLPSFGGASSAENAFYVNGMNVTDDFNFQNLAQPPFEALQSFQIKTGGISAAFGNALGGVINMTTKQGGNTFHAGANVYWQPKSLYFAPPNTYTYGSSGIEKSIINRFNDDERGSLRYNIWASGPIVPDHLFFYAMAQETDRTHNFSPTGDPTGNPGLERDTKGKNPYGLVRLDWDINNTNSLTVTAWKATQAIDGKQYELNPPAGNLDAVNKGVYDGAYKLTQGSRAAIGKYTWAPTADFNLSALWGYVRFDDGSSSANPDCPDAEDNRQQLNTHLGCWVLGNVRPGRYDARHEYRLDGEWLSGSTPGLATGHDITFGLGYSSFESAGINHYSGPVFNGVPGIQWQYNKVPTSGIVNGVCFPDGSTPTNSQTDPCPGYIPTGADYYVAGRQFYDHGLFSTTNRDEYIEDNWQIIQNLRIRLGLRNQSFRNYNQLNQMFISEDNEIAPRLGFSWDVNGNSTFKVFGSYSEYFIPVANNTNARAAGGELDVYNQDYTYQSIDPTTGAPIGLGTHLGPNSIQGTGAIPDPTTVAATNLKPMSEKETILGFQKAFNTKWTYGVRFIHRWLINGEDDICSFLSAPPFHPDLAELAKENNWDVNSFLSTVSPTTCLISNPGNDVDTYADINGDGKLESITIPNSFIKMPKAVRYYNALEFTLSRAFSDGWLFGASYTWSHSYGNEEGYVLSSIGQTDAGLTESFDFAGLEQGAAGDLPNDRRHVFKAWGAYQFAPDWRVGGNLLIESGAPVSCLGTYPDAFDISTFYGAFSHYCGGAPGPTATFPNGATLVTQGSYGRTPWVYNLNLQLSFMPQSIPGLSISGRWFNVLNAHHATWVSNSYDDGQGVPVPTFLRTTEYQQPGYVELAVRYDFM